MNGNGVFVGIEVDRRTVLSYSSWTVSGGLTGDPSSFSGGDSTGIQESARQNIDRLRRCNDGPIFRSFSLRSVHHAPQTNEKSVSN